MDTEVHHVTTRDRGEAPMVDEKLEGLRRLSDCLTATEAEVEQLLGGRPLRTTRATAVVCKAMWRAYTMASMYRLLTEQVVSEIREKIGALQAVQANTEARLRKIEAVQADTDEKLREREAIEANNADLLRKIEAEVAEDSASWNETLAEWEAKWEMVMDEAVLRQNIIDHLTRENTHLRAELDQVGWGWSAEEDA
jgi:chromosome segregation ATPase